MTRLVCWFSRWAWDVHDWQHAGLPGPSHDYSRMTPVVCRRCGKLFEI